MNKSSKSPSKSPSGILEQYFAIKRQHEECLVLMRVGDFYELFFADAETAARAADLTLTSRGRYRGEKVPMAGMPAHAAWPYIEKLASAGHRIALCEQEKSDSGGLYLRRPVRIFTPGTLSEQSLLAAEEARYLLALALAPENRIALAWADVSTGEFAAKTLPRADLAGEILRLAPVEILLPKDLAASLPDDIEPAIGAIAITARPEGDFAAEAGRRALSEILPAAKQLRADFPAEAAGAAGALAVYVRFTQMGQDPQLKPVQLEKEEKTLAMDAATRAALELAHNRQGGKSHSLLSLLDQSKTGAGARLLRARLVQPLTDLEIINRRLDEVEFFHQKPKLAAKLAGLLEGQPDLARALTRLARPSALASSGLTRHNRLRDLLDIGRALTAGLEIAALLAAESSPPRNIELAVRSLASLPASLAEKLTQAFAANEKANEKEGGKEDEKESASGLDIAPGYDTALDHWRQEKAKCARRLSDYETHCRKHTGIRPLKLRFLAGRSLLEAPAAQGQKLLSAPYDDEFTHRQTLGEKMRFSSETLLQLDAALFAANAEIAQRRETILAGLAADIAPRRSSLDSAASACARLDVAQALAASAKIWRCTRPQLDEESGFYLQQARHLPVEEALKDSRNVYQANDCALAAKNGSAAAQILMLTGANMSGKSTYLRALAHIFCLAQMGAFVPAQEARIGIADRLFARIGAQDELAQARSTFMVEMIETAVILHRATAKSFVLIDEIGRGTATYDGLAIAQAVAEYIHDTIGCRAGFATHFHELTRLADSHKRIVNASLPVAEKNGKLVFSYRLALGEHAPSLGVPVAKLAGMPQPVIARARSLLAELEAHARRAAT